MTMHELSIAIAILEIAGRRVPTGCVLTCVRVVAGPMRAIDAAAMELAWRAVAADSGMPRLKLELELRPWALACARCGRRWNSQELDGVCACGSDRVSPTDGDELDVVSIEVDDERKEPGHADLGCGKRHEAQRRSSGDEPPAVQRGGRVRHRCDGRARQRKDGAD
jgi:Zn finger protein HypA/HybF involved in hydrogenase expression